MRLILRFWDAVPIRVIAQFQHLVDFPRLAFGFEVSSSKFLRHAHRQFEGRRYTRTVPMPGWVKNVVDQWVPASRTLHQTERAFSVRFADKPISI